MKKFFGNWTLFEKIWLITFSLIAICLSLVWGDTLFSFSVFITGCICVVLVARGSIWNYSYGLYNAAGYSWIAYKNGLFGELMLNAGYFGPAQIIGIFMWKRNLAKGSTIIMRKMQTSATFLWLGISALGILIYGDILSTIPYQNTPYFDSCTTVLSVFAMVLMMLRYREQWILWIIVDIVSVAMWAYRLHSGIEGAPAMIVMWAAYLVNASYGWYKWNKLAIRKEAVYA